MESTTIKALFGRRNIRFVIPAYQRAYTWDKKQFSQFREDLQDCAGSDYYLGHFLFEQDGDTFYVIDGQQRLTTSIIFFSAFLHVIKSREAEWMKTDKKEIIQDLLLDVSDYYLKDCRHNRQKFATVEYDNNFFIDTIIEHHNSVSNDDLTSKSKAAIHRALCFFEEWLKDCTIDDMLLYVSSLENAAITTFVVKDKLQACQIFAYQNDRGKRLSNLEILKAYFMLQIYRTPFDTFEHESGITYIERAFEDIYRYIVLVSVDEDSVLSYYWKAIGPKGYYSENVVHEIKAWINACSKEEKFERIKEFVKGLSKSFQVVNQIEHDNSFYTANLKNLKNMAISYPILIKAKLSNVSKELFDKIIKLMENITFRSLIRGGRADIISRMQQIIPKTMTPDSFSQMIDTAIWKLNNDWWWGYWSDKQMLEHIKSGWFYGNRVDNYLLWRYEQWQCCKNYPNPKICFSDVISNESIEHIAPQTQSSPLENGYGIYEDKDNPQQGIVSGEYMNCVGNLMLMAGSQNSSLGNKPFALKLKVYGSDNLLYQQKEIIEFVEDKNNPIWDKDCIKRRRDKIIQAAKEIWSLDNI